MNRRRVLFRCSLVLTIGVAIFSIAVAAIPGSSTSAPSASGGHVGTVGVAGPLGPQAISGLASYFKRVTFSSDQLSQYQDISAYLPAGRYLLELHASGDASSRGLDCKGVAFPLTESADSVTSFTGYVSVARGDTATVVCYEEATAAGSTATYELFYIPANPTL